MGIIISTSSIVGFICDLLFSKLFPRKPYAFFLWLTLLAAFMFPATYSFLPPLVSTFLIGMVTWGIYYELLQFSHFNFINTFIPKAQFTQAWGTLNSFSALAYIIGPLLAVHLITQNFRSAFSVPLLLYSVASMGLIALLLFLKKKPIQTSSEIKHSLFTEMRIWKSLLSKVWPVYIFLFLIASIDSTFWTIGALISQELSTITSIGSWFLPAYTLPALFIWLVISRLPVTGKKRIAFIAAAIGGAIMSIVGFTSEPLILLLVVFSASIFIAISFPEIKAVFEDYVSRLGKAGTSMVGLQASSTSAAYVIGPIIAGFLGQILGHRQVFTVIGSVLSLFSIYAYFTVPKKIRLPEAEIANI